MRSLNRPKPWDPIVPVGICTLLFLVGACASTAPTGPRHERRVGEEPKAGETAERNVGEAIYTRYDYTTAESPRLIDNYGRQYLLGQIFIPRSTTLGARPRRGGGSEYCTNEPTYTGPGGPSIVCFMGPPTVDYFTHVRVPPLKYGNWTAMDRQVHYQAGEVMVGEGFKMELIYQGVAADVLRLSYREYVENLIRPAFQQDLTYTLSPQGPTEIQFRTLRIQVLRADNNGLAYQVLHGLQ